MRGGRGDVGRERREGGLREGWSISHQVRRIDTTLVILGGWRKDKSTRVSTGCGPIAHGDGRGHVRRDSDGDKRGGRGEGGGEDGRDGDGCTAIFLAL